MFHKLIVCIRMIRMVLIQYHPILLSLLTGFVFIRYDLMLNLDDAKESIPIVISALLLGQLVLFPLVYVVIALHKHQPPFEFIQILNIEAADYLLKAVFSGVLLALAVYFVPLSIDAGSWIEKNQFALIAMLTVYFVCAYFRSVYYSVRFLAVPDFFSDQSK